MCEDGGNIWRERVAQVFLDDGHIFAAHAAELRDVLADVVVNFFYSAKSTLVACCNHVHVAREAVCIDVQGTACHLLGVSVAFLDKGVRAQPDGYDKEQEGQNVQNAAVRRSMSVAQYGNENVVCDVLLLVCFKILLYIQYGRNKSAAAFFLKEKLVFGLLGLG